MDPDKFSDDISTCALCDNDLPTAVSEDPEGLNHLADLYNSTLTLILDEHGPVKEESLLQRSPQ